MSLFTAIARLNLIGIFSLLKSMLERWSYSNCHVKVTIKTLVMTYLLEKTELLKLSC